MKAAFIFDNLGPYHRARLKAASKALQVLAIEVAACSSDYGWERQSADAAFETVTLLTQTRKDGSRAELASRLEAALDRHAPEVVFVPGWSVPAALRTIKWCSRNNVPVVLMSESTAQDQRRRWPREVIKRRILGLSSAALAGGQAQADYLVGLGFPPERIFFGYDAVDNEYFGRRGEESRNRRAQISGERGLPDTYFLASARFIAKKNLPGLLQAYARYRELSAKRQAESS